MKNVFIILMLTLAVSSAHAEMFKCGAGNGTVTRGDVNFDVRAGGVIATNVGNNAKALFRYQGEETSSSGSKNVSYLRTSLRNNTEDVFFLLKGDYYVRSLTLHYLRSGDAPLIYVTYVNKNDGNWTRSFLCHPAN